MSKPAPTGIGLGIRASFIAEIERGEAGEELAFVEVSPENYMHRGGRMPQRLEAVCDRYPLITHGLMMSLGSTDPLSREYLHTLRDFLQRYEPPWHSDHLCFSGLSGSLLHDLLPLPFTSATARRVAERLRFAEDTLGIPMAIENISWYAYLGQPHYAETDFICEILERAQCRLLLDVNNVFVNAQNHGFDPFAWLAEIPLERVVQLHVAGHEAWDDDLIVDTHGADVRREVEDLLHWVISRAGPRPVLLERDSNIPDLHDLLAEVRRLDQTYRSALEAWGAHHG